MATSLTEPLRAEHRELLPRLDDLRAAAAEIGNWQRDVTPSRLAEVVRFMREHLVPHARAEEAVLYPAFERALGAPGATVTMVADHVEIVRRIDALEGTIIAIGPRTPRPDQLEDLRAQLYGLWAILLLHFGKEEDVLLPELDVHLTPAEADALFAELASVAHGG